MKIDVMKCFPIIILLLTLCSCGANPDPETNPEILPDSLAAASVSSGVAVPVSAATHPEKMAKPTRRPRDISELNIYDAENDKYDAFTYQEKKFRIKDTTLYCKDKNGTRKISLSNRPENNVDGKKYDIPGCCLLSGYLFYTCDEYTEEVWEDGASFEYGASWLYRINLETEQIDAAYILEENMEEQDGFHTRVLGADPDSGYLYLYKKSHIYVLDLSLTEIDSVIFPSSSKIENIYWTEGYVLTDVGIYQMNLALNERDQLELPALICRWPSGSSYNNAEIIGIYGNFLYGYTYYYGNYAIAGHYFQIDLKTRNYQTLSADQKKSFSGTYDAESLFETKSFADKHVLYSEGRDHSDGSWDPIRIRYILSEDGTVEIKTKKIDP